MGVWKCALPPTLYDGTGRRRRWCETACIFIACRGIRRERCRAGPSCLTPRDADSWRSGSQHALDPSTGAWVDQPLTYAKYRWAGFGYLTGSIRSMITQLNALVNSPVPDASALAAAEARLAVSGADVLAALEVSAVVGPVATSYCVGRWILSHASGACV